MGKRRLAGVLEGENGEKDVTESEVVGSSDEEEEQVEAKPLGDVIKRSNKGKAERRHYEAMELNDNRYALEDAVLIAPERKGDKPYVAIIKEIKQSKDGSIAVTGQWFYRPEEAEKKGGGSWVASDARELFYSFHRDEVPGESVMHKCVVHFIPPQKQLPLRTKHPGFVIRHVYDTGNKTLWKLTDRDYKDPKQQEIDQLIQKTKLVLGELPDLGEGEAEPSPIIDVEPEKSTKKQTRKPPVPPIVINKDEGNGNGNEAAEKGDSQVGSKASTPASCRTPTPGSGGFQSDVADLLQTHKARTGQSSRDRWIEKLVATLKNVLSAEESKIAEEGADGDTKEKSPKTDAESTPAGDTKEKSPKTDAESKPAGETKEKSPKTDAQSKPAVSDVDVLRKDINDLWPEPAIAAVCALEKIAFEFHGTDVHKYNLKMRQLDFNLKKSSILTRRLLTQDLDPSAVFQMSPQELKEGYTAAETKAREPPEVETLQMIEARCGICGEKLVGVKDIIHTGYGDKYQLECLKCGNSWYAARDFVSTVTTDQVVSASPTVGLAPWATSKLAEVEKDLASPKDSKKSGGRSEGSTPPPDRKSAEASDTKPPESHYEEVEKSTSESIFLSGAPEELAERVKDKESAVEESKSETKTAMVTESKIDDGASPMEVNDAGDDLPKVEEKTTDDELATAEPGVVEKELPPGDRSEGEVGSTSPTLLKFL